MQVGTGDQVQHIVGAVTQSQLIGLHPQLFRQCCLQGKTGAIRIQVQLMQMLEGMQGLVAGTQGVFIAGQLDDIGEAKLPLQLLDRLARFIGLELLNATVGEFDVIASHDDSFACLSGTPGEFR